MLPPSHIQLGSERPGGTRLIETMRSALVEVPPERLAGVVLLTDGQVHDVPAIDCKNLPPELGGAPVHALIAGKKGERDRLIVIGAVAALRRGRPRGHAPSSGSRIPPAAPRR